MTYSLGDVKILVVEDMQPMLSLTKSILSIMGFKNLIGARSGDEGYEMFCKHNPDIVISDWLMEPEDGLELINNIRTDPASPNPYARLF